MFDGGMTGSSIWSKRVSGVSQSKKKARTGRKELTREVGAFGIEKSLL